VTVRAGRVTLTVAALGYRIVDLSAAEE